MMATTHKAAEAPASTAALPAPQERPEADVVIYDGDCRFCTGQVQRLARWDGKGKLAFVSLHDPLVAERYPELSHERLMDDMHVVASDGRTYAGAAAFRYLSRRLPRLWWLAPLMHVPFSLPLWQWGYRQFAKRRYRLGKAESCDDEACKVHFE